MTELLKHWAELEPERCRVNGAHRNDYLVVIGDEWYRIATTLRKEGEGLGAEQDVLAAVIEAIEARDAKAVKHNAGGDREHDLREWRYSLGGHSEESWAEVWSGLPLTVGRSYRAESQQPAVALLGAYLAALEAEQ